MVGLVDFLEEFLLAGVGIGVVLLGEQPEGLLDLLVGGLGTEVEGLVVVLFGVELLQAEGLLD